MFLSDGPIPYTEDLTPPGGDHGGLFGQHQALAQRQGGGWTRLKGVGEPGQPVGGTAGPVGVPGPPRPVVAGAVTGGQVTAVDLTDTHGGQRGELGVEFPDQGHDLTELVPVRGRQRPSGDLSQRCGHPGKPFRHPGPRPSTRCSPPRRPSSRGSPTRSSRARGSRARGRRAFGIGIRRHDWPPPWERTHTPTPGVSAKPNVSSSIAGGRTTNQGQASSSNPTATPTRKCTGFGETSVPRTPLTLPAATPVDQPKHQKLEHKFEHG